MAITETNLVPWLDLCKCRRRLSLANRIIMRMKTLQGFHGVVLTCQTLFGRLPLHCLGSGIEQRRLTKTRPTVVHNDTQRSKRLHIDESSSEESDDFISGSRQQHHFVEGQTHLSAFYLGVSVSLDDFAMPLRELTKRLLLAEY